MLGKLLGKGEKILLSNIAIGFWQTLGMAKAPKPMAASRKETAHDKPPQTQTPPNRHDA
jgi:hypothetical protein